MAGGRFSKTADWLSNKLNAANMNEGVIGGSLTVAPAGLVASQGQATLPGDRIILSPMDGLALQNNNTGNLYTGTYRYGLFANASSTPTRGHGLFWVSSAANNNQAQNDALYQVTSDEVANYGVSLFAGVAINSPGKSNNNVNVFWWFQESGKATCAFRNAITGTPAIGAAVTLAAAGNSNNAIDVGAFDVLAGANGTAAFNAANAYATVGAFVQNYVGPAETLPANNNTAIVDLTLSRSSFRW